MRVANRRSGRGRGLSYVAWQQADGYVARCLNVNVASDGDTEQQAINNLREALELYFADINGDHLPAVENPRLGQLTIKTS